MNPTVTLTAISSMLGGPAADALAWTLIHFLWQGTALGGAAWLAMRAVGSARGRYLAGVIALAAMSVTAIGTFVWLARVTPLTVQAEMGASTMALAGVAPGEFVPLTTVTTAASAGSMTLAVIVLAWLVGVAVLCIRLAGGFVFVRRLAARAVEPVDHAIESMARGVADRLSLSSIVRIVQSPALRTPVLIGWLKPVVLLPAAAVAGLSPAQLEALIAHELAHVKRHDYLVNILQSVIETVLFYHPAVWWLSREVRREREHCCDDLAVAVSDRIVYASALTELASFGPGARFALGAVDGPLFRRVSRILSGSADHRRPSAWIAVPIVGLMLVLVPAGVVLTREPEQRATAAPPRERVNTDPLPAPGDRATAAVQHVPSNAPREQFTVTTSEIVPQSAQAASAALQRRMREVEQALELLAEQRHELEAARIEAETSTQRQAARERVKELQAELQRRGSPTAGEDSKAMAAHYRQELAQAEAALRALESEAEFRTKAVALAALERKQQREHERLSRELEAAQMAAHERLQREVEARAAVEAEVQASAFAQPLIELTPSFEERQRDLQLRLEELNRLSRNSVRIPPIAPDEAVARENDVVSLDIEGESGLPRGYPVQADGTIRLPLIGPISVEGMTSARIQDVVRNELSDRRLAAGRRVTATLHRPR